MQLSKGTGWPAAHNRENMVGRSSHVSGTPRWYNLRLPRPHIPESWSMPEEIQEASNETRYFVAGLLTGIAATALGVILGGVF